MPKYLNITSRRRHCYIVSGWERNVFGIDSPIDWLVRLLASSRTKCVGKHLQNSKIGERLYDRSLFHCECCLWQVIDLKVQSYDEAECLKCRTEMLVTESVSFIHNQNPTNSVLLAGWYNLEREKNARIRNVKKNIFSLRFGREIIPYAIVICRIIIFEMDV